eukprot:g2622.t1
MAEWTGLAPASPRPPLAAVSSPRRRPGAAPVRDERTRSHRTGRIPGAGLLEYIRTLPQDWQEQKDLARRLRRLDSKELYEVVHGRLDSFDFVLLNSNVARERNRARRFPWLSQAAWAAAKVLPQLPEESRSFLAQVSQASAAALRVSKPFDARDAANLLWSLATAKLVDYQHLPLKPQLTGVDLRSAVGPGKIFSRRWGALAPRDLSLLAWSFANSNSELLASEVPLIAQVALPQLSDFDHQGISNLVWALGTVSIADRELFSRVGQLVTTGDYSARQVANICWAYATVSLLHTEFIEKAKALATRMGSGSGANARSFDAFRADEQVSLLWSFAVLGVQWDELQVPALPRLSAREAGNLCWSLAVLGHHHQEVLTGCAQMLEASFGSNLEVHMTQWHMAALAFKLETGLPLQLEGLQHFAARAAAVAQHRAVQQQGTSSKLHGEVSREVRRRCRSEVMQVGRPQRNPPKT